MFEEKNNNLDDLIGGNQQPIIVQEKSSDKKFLYTLLILLVILFLVALGLIAFLGSKYFGGNNSTAQVQQSVPVKQEQAVKMEPVTKQVVEQPVQQVVKKPVTKPVVKSAETKAVEQKAQTEDTSLSDLEQLVKTEEKPKPKTVVEKSITKVAKSAGKGLSQQELATIAKLVAQELEKSKAVAKPLHQATQQKATTNSATQNDAALVASLEQAQTDTLEDEQVDTNRVKKSDVKASGNKKIDTFNKVIVKKKSGGDDELAKLSSEIDTILQNEDVQKQEKRLKNKVKVIDKEINAREGELRFIVVKKGDTLSSIAYRAYGRWSAYTKIYKANPDLVKNPNRIYVGMKLRVPVDAEYKAAGN